MYLDVEEAGWGGISGALGLAGFTNLDVVRNPSLGTAPYLARFMRNRSFLCRRRRSRRSARRWRCKRKLPARRLEIRVGKFSTADFFDINPGGTDSHLQFMNWTVDNNGAYDYAADTRGYTYRRDRRVRGPLSGSALRRDADAEGRERHRLRPGLRQSRAENLELELRPTLQTGTRRFASSATSTTPHGQLREALSAVTRGGTPTPDITATRTPGAIKDGFGLNFQQEFAKDMWALRSLGLERRQDRVFAYTETNRASRSGPTSSEPGGRGVWIEPGWHSFPAVSSRTTSNIWQTAAWDSFWATVD